MYIMYVYKFFPFFIFFHLPLYLKFGTLRTILLSNFFLFPIKVYFNLYWQSTPHDAVEKLVTIRELKTESTFFFLLQYLKSHMLRLLFQILDSYIFFLFTVYQSFDSFRLNYPRAKQETSLS